MFNIRRAEESVRSPNPGLTHLHNVCLWIVNSTKLQGEKETNSCKVLQEKVATIIRLARSRNLHCSLQTFFCCCCSSRWLLMYWNVISEVQFCVPVRVGGSTCPDELLFKKRVLISEDGESIRQRKSRPDTHQAFFWNCKNFCYEYKKILIVPNKCFYSTFISVYFIFLLIDYEACYHLH